MRLYVLHRNTKKKVYVKSNASCKEDLRRELKGDSFTIADGIFKISYDVSEVKAERSCDYEVIAGLSGIIIGLFLGGWGIFFGALFGLEYGIRKNEEEKRKIDLFNSSQ